MGWRAADLYAHSVWEFCAIWDGWVKFHATAATAAPMSRGELDDIIRDWNLNGP